MPTTAERHALAFLAGVALLGGSARIYTQHRAASALTVAETTGAVAGQLSAVDSARNRKRAARRTTKPKQPTSRAARQKSATVDAPPAVVDVDRANVEELERLPRVGPALAARIVANRDSLGPFGSLQALGEVRGIGPAMLKTLDPMVTFSGRPRPVAVNRTKKR